MIQKAKMRVGGAGAGTQIEWGQHLGGRGKKQLKKKKKNQKKKKQKRKRK